MRFFSAGSLLSSPLLLVQRALPPSSKLTSDAISRNVSLAWLLKEYLALLRLLRGDSILSPISHVSWMLERLPWLFVNALTVFKS
ncbi:hypothetical protein FB451DRAFT_1396586 [Mycena latifolia]|nr:hypothetical protein FB451DRAFT_1396586 [Mycena latifolia]